MVLTSIFQGHYHTVFSLLSSAQGCEWIRLRGEREQKQKEKRASVFIWKTKRFTFRVKILNISRVR